MKIINILKKHDVLTILRNFSYMSIFQLANLIFPIFITPYLVAHIGVAKFGIVNYAFALATFLVVIADYGFNYSATQAIAVNKDNPQKLNEIFSSTYYIKSILVLIAMFLFMMSTLALPKLNANLFVALTTMLIIPAYSSIPTWFLLGIEKVRTLAIINFSAKVLYVLLVVLLIKEESDFIYINLFWGLSYLMVGICGIYVVIKRYKARFVFVSFAQMIEEIKDGFYLFITNLSIYANSYTNVIILGLWVDEKSIGYYSIAEKVMLFVKQVMNVFTQVVYPRMCIYAKEGGAKIIPFIKNIFFPFIAMIIVFCIIIISFRDPLAYFFSKTIDRDLTTLLTLLSIVPMIIAFNIIPYQTLLAFNKRKEYSIIYLIGTIVITVSNLFLSRHMGAKGTALGIITGELVITTGLYYKLYVNRNMLSN